MLQAPSVRSTGFQVLRDFEGLSGHLHDYIVDIAKSMLQRCQADDGKVLLACSSTSQQVTDDLDAIEEVDASKMYLVQLCDFMWQNTPSFEERMATVRNFRGLSG